MSTATLPLSSYTWFRMFWMRLARIWARPQHLIDSITASSLAVRTSFHPPGNASLSWAKARAEVMSVVFWESIVDTRESITERSLLFSYSPWRPARASRAAWASFAVGREKDGKRDEEVAVEVEVEGSCLTRLLDEDDSALTRRLTAPQLTGPGEGEGEGGEGRVRTRSGPWLTRAQCQVQCRLSRRAE